MQRKKQNKKETTEDVYFSAEENNMGLPPVPFHPHSPLHSLNVTDIVIGGQVNAKR